jgi:hypothetical protein
MSTAADEYESLISALSDAKGVTTGQMFGKPCLKVGGKAFVALHKETIVFKLSGDAHKMALALKGAVLWDPSGKKRPMKEWVALPITAAKSFMALARDARTYVVSSI